MGCKAGFVAVLGRPNAGKSTLVNRLVGQKVAIVTPRPQTTRNRIQGIVNREGAQVVLVDTPGIHKAGTALSRQMMSEVQHALDGVDVLALMVDAAEAFGAGDRYAVEMVKRFDGPSVLLLNKVDRIEKPQLLPLIERYRQMHEFAEVFPISALTGDGVEEMLARVIALLPEGEPYFPPDQVTDQPERFLAAELIREKAILRTRDELPHSLGVLVESFEEGAKLIRIRATIFVERDGQKGIVIGERGEMLKRIGTEARKELEELLGVKIFLKLFVKVARDWRDKPALVRQMDWRVQLEGLGKE
jgi:GTP-binding protein Era